MGRKATTALENVYFQCRKRAAKTDTRLNSREGAAELLNISPSTLADYELGITEQIPVESVMAMANLYKAPFLMTRFCSCECPLGTACKVDLPTCQPSIQPVVLQIAAYIKPDTIRQVRDDLIVIASDGRVNDWERDKLSDIVRSLEVIARGAISLKLINAV